MPAYANKIENEELLKAIASGKVDIYKMANRILEDIDEISQKPKGEWDDQLIRQLNALKGVFTMVTGFIARTPDLADERPKVAGSQESKTSRGRNSLGPFKMPKPTDLRD